MPTSKRFRDKFKYSARLEEANRVLCEYPGRLPVVVDVPETVRYKLEYKKYLVEKNMLLSSFSFMIRRNMDVPPESSLFFMCGNTIPRFNDSMLTTYENYKGQDNFLVIEVREENTFGT